jgi:hypothetical protein
VVALDLPAHQDNPISVGGIFSDGQRLRDHYSGKTAIVINGRVTLRAFRCSDCTGCTMKQQTHFKRISCMATLALLMQFL